MAATAAIMNRPHSRWIVIGMITEADTVVDTVVVMEEATVATGSTPCRKRVPLVLLVERERLRATPVPNATSNCGTGHRPRRTPDRRLVCRC